MRANLGLYLTVFLAGAGTLAMEILMSRYMHPAFGASVFIWGAILSVTLLCLAVGYQWGGWLADRSENPEGRMVSHILLAAVCVGLLPLFGHKLLLAGMKYGAIWGPILVSFGLFAIPVTLLSTVVPLGIGARLRRDGTRPAGASGALFAISTAGSILGALLAAYIGVPLLGISKSLFVVSFCLILIVLPALLRGTALKTAVVLLLALAATRAIPPEKRSGPRLSEGVRFLARISTQYTQLEVIEDLRDGSRILLLNGASQNRVMGESWDRSLFDYIPLIVRKVPALPGKPRALVLGLGAGTMVRGLGRKGYQVEAVEIDPAVLRVAREYFGFPRDDRFPVHLMDARAYLVRAAAERPASLDLLVVDLTGGGLHIEHVYTKEAYELMRRLLKPDGLLVMNFVAYVGGPDGRVLMHCAATVSQLFAQVELTSLEPEKDRQGKLGQAVLFARIRRGSSLLDSRDHPIEIDRSLPAVTDNWNPLGLWSVRASAEWHQNIRIWLGSAALIPH